MSTLGRNGYGVATALGRSGAIFTRTAMAMAPRIVRKTACVRNVLVMGGDCGLPRDCGVNAGTLTGR